jgi:hypothetical protein
MQRQVDKEPNQHPTNKQFESKRVIQVDIVCSQFISSI